MVESYKYTPEKRQKVIDAILMDGWVPDHQDNFANVYNKENYNGRLTLDRFYSPFACFEIQNRSMSLRCYATLVDDQTIKEFFEKINKLEALVRLV